MVYSFLSRQYALVSQGGWRFFFRLAARFLGALAGLPISLALLLSIRVLRPWILIRVNQLYSPRIGHFSANTELYLCEQAVGLGVPKGRYVDLTYHGGLRIANRQLALMWSRRLRIWPKWLLEPVFWLNRLIPGGRRHEVPVPSHGDRDFHDLRARTPMQLAFTEKEELRGQANLRAMGIPAGADFICLIVRDDTYLSTRLPNPTQWSHHSYRDTNIEDYLLAAEALADRGCYVLRMGEVVKDQLRSGHSRVIDYATARTRSDFMDIYLCAKCLFSLSSGTGLDGVVSVFRRPLASVNFVPVGRCSSFLEDHLFLAKRHRLVGADRELSLREIFDHGVGFSLWTDLFESQQVELIDNTPEEIKSVALEMLDRVKGVWRPQPEDEVLQRRFWKVFPLDAEDDHRTHLVKWIHVDNKSEPLATDPIHGSNVRARYGTQFLRDNSQWLQ